MTDPEMDLDIDQDYAEGWRPKDGDTIIGKVESLSRAWSDESESFYPIITIVKDDGERVAVHAFHMALKNQLKELKPKQGETIGIKMVGKVPLKNNPSRSIVKYNVKIKGRTADVWDGIPDDARGAKATAPADSGTSDDADEDIPF
jgi:hypothetical protein